MITKRTNHIAKWSDLPVDLLRLILSKMSILNIPNFKYVCSPWYITANAYISCDFKKKVSSQVPILVFLPEEEEDKEDNDSSRVCFYSPHHNSFYKPLNRYKELRDGLCIGSSHGWLVMLNEKLSDPYLFNPFTLVKIQLPPITTFPHVYELEMLGNHQVAISYHDPQCGETGGYLDSKKDIIGGRFILKAGCCACDDNESKFIVVMIFEFDRFYYGNELAFCRSDRDTKWKRLPASLNCYGHYRDVICYSDKFYTLNGYSIEIWDIVEGSDFPVKKRVIDGFCPEKTPEQKRIASYLEFNMDRFLVELSSGEFMLVEQLVEVVDETCKSPVFLVYKLDVSQKKWVEVESIGNNVVFLGENINVCNSEDVRGCKVGCIYYTYGYRYNRIEVGESDFLAGVYSLADKSIEPFEFWNKEVVPFWIVPNP